jgi:hypothetical protein
VVWTSLEGLFAFTAGLLAAFGWRRFVLVYRPGRTAAYRYQPAHAKTPQPAAPPGTARPAAAMPAAVWAAGGAEGTRPWTAPLAAEAEWASQWGDRDFGSGLQRAATLAHAVPTHRPEPPDLAGSSDRMLRPATDQVSFGAAAILAAAERDAARIRQQASDQAAKIRATAEADAGELRAVIEALTDELAHMTSYLTGAFGISAHPAGAPVFPPPSKPAAPPASPTARPTTSPAAEPASRPTKPAAQTAKPATRPAKRAARPRQYAAARGTTIVTVALVLLTAAAGTTETALHGFAFFVFRSAGTGATNDNGLQEDQGPGQPNARGIHHHVPGPHHCRRRATSPATPAPAPSSASAGSCHG